MSKETTTPNRWFRLIACGERTYQLECLRAFKLFDQSVTVGQRSGSLVLSESKRIAAIQYDRLKHYVCTNPPSLFWLDADSELSGNFLLPFGSYFKHTTVKLVTTLENNGIMITDSYLENCVIEGEEDVSYGLNFNGNATQASLIDSRLIDCFIGLYPIGRSPKPNTLVIAHSQLKDSVLIHAQTDSCIHQSTLQGVYGYQQWLIERSTLTKQVIRMDYQYYPNSANLLVIEDSELYDVTCQATAELVAFIRTKLLNKHVMLNDTHMVCLEGKCQAVTLTEYNHQLADKDPLPLAYHLTKVYREDEPFEPCSDFPINQTSHAIINETHFN